MEQQKAEQQKKEEQLRQLLISLQLEIGEDAFANMESMINQKVDGKGELNPLQKIDQKILIVKTFTTYSQELKSINASLLMLLLGFNPDLSQAAETLTQITDNARTAATTIPTDQASTGVERAGRRSGPLASIMAIIRRSRKEGFTPGAGAGADSVAETVPEAAVVAESLLYAPPLFGDALCKPEEEQQIFSEPLFGPAPTAKLPAPVATSADLEARVNLSGPKTQLPAAGATGASDGLFGMALPPEMNQTSLFSVAPKEVSIPVANDIKAQRKAEEEAQQKAGEEAQQKAGEEAQRAAAAQAAAAMSLVAEGTPQAENLRLAARQAMRRFQKETNAQGAAGVSSGTSSDSDDAWSGDEQKSVSVENLAAAQPPAQPSVSPAPAIVDSHDGYENVSYGLDRDDPRAFHNRQDRMRQDNAAAGLSTSTGSAPPAKPPAPAPAPAQPSTPTAEKDPLAALKAARKRRQQATATEGASVRAPASAPPASTSGGRPASWSSPQLTAPAASAPAAPPAPAPRQAESWGEWPQPPAPAPATGYWSVPAKHPAPATGSWSVPAKHAASAWSARPKSDGPDSAQADQPSSGSAGASVVARAKMFGGK